MSVEEIQQAIQDLDEREFSALRAWFGELAWQRWDSEVAADAESGRLDFLVAEATMASTSA